MNPQTPTPTPSNPPNVWLGGLGVLIAVAFAGLAVFDTSLSAPASVPSASVTAPGTDQAVVHVSEDTSALGTADHPLPLYLSESGAHAPHTPEAKPAGPPGPQAVSLFDRH